MSSATLKNIAIIGGSGNTGAPIVAGLLASGKFNVTILSRIESKATFPAGVTVKKIDLKSESELRSAFEGQDAVLCAIHDVSTITQVPIINAAYKADVKRFIPSEFAATGLAPPVSHLDGVAQDRKTILDLLNQKVKEGEAAGKDFHWTAVNCGAFFDWFLYSGFGDIHLPPNKTAKIWDSGNNKFSATNQSTVAQAVISILTTAEAQTRDRFVNIASFATSQNEMVAALEKASGEKWAVGKTTTKDQLAVAEKALEGGDFEAALMDWLRSAIYSGQEAALFPEEKLDNELLGLPKEEINDVVEKILRGEKV